MMGTPSLENDTYSYVESIGESTILVYFLTDITTLHRGVKSRPDLKLSLSQWRDRVGFSPNFHTLKSTKIISSNLMIARSRRICKYYDQKKKYMFFLLRCKRFYVILFVKYKDVQF